MYGFDPTLPPPLLDESQKLFAPESWALLSSSISNTYITGEPYEIELKTVKDDGSTGWMWAKGEAVVNANGKITDIWGAVHDITLRKQAEEELKQKGRELTRQNELFNSLITNLPIGVFMVEAPSGKPLVANEAALKLLGSGILPDASKHNLEEVYQAFINDTKTPYPVDKMPIVQGMEGEYSHVNDMLVLRPDGSKIQLEIYGSPVKDDKGDVWASLVSFTDITERRKAENELVHARARLQRAEFISKSGNWELHIDSNKIIASEGACKLYGLKGEEFSFESVKNIPLPEYRLTLNNALHNLIEKEEPYNLEFKIRNAVTGKISDIQSFAFYDKYSRTLFGAIQDISESKSREQELVETKFLSSLSQKSLKLPVKK
jgi:PAS domain-containing protein